MHVTCELAYLLRACADLWCARAQNVAACSVWRKSVQITPRTQHAIVTLTRFPAHSSRTRSFSSVASPSDTSSAILGASGRRDRRSMSRAARSAAARLVRPRLCRVRSIACVTSRVKVTSLGTGVHGPVKRFGYKHVCGRKRLPVREVLSAHLARPLGSLRDVTSQGHFTWNWSGPAKRCGYAGEDVRGSAVI